MEIKNIIIGVSAFFLIRFVIAKKNKQNWIFPVWDIHTEKRILKLHPKIRQRVREFINRAYVEHGVKLRIGIDGNYRSFSEQTKLYNKGRTDTNKIVTNAKAGQSFHNYGLALDLYRIVDGYPIIFFSTSSSKRIVQLGKSIGFVWGGDFKRKDYNHFQMTFGNSWENLLNKYLSNNLKNGYVII